jgi:type I restriction enzyme R subunit
LNRVHPEKSETMVLDFANEAQEIAEAFAPYYEKTLLSEATDPNLLYDLERRFGDFDVFGPADVEAFAKVYFDPRATQDRLYALLAPSVDRYKAMGDKERAIFKGTATDYVRLYSFLSQILTFADADLEKLYVFVRLLRRYLPAERSDLPHDIEHTVDMETYRIGQRHSGMIKLPRGEGEVAPIGASGGAAGDGSPVEPLSAIIRDLNKRFGTDFTDEDKVFIAELETRLLNDPALAASIRANTPENARLTFDHVVSDQLQDMVDTNFQFYKRVTDDPAFAKYFLDWLFERFRRGSNEPR